MGSGSQDSDSYDYDSLVYKDVKTSVHVVMRILKQHLIQYLKNDMDHFSAE